MTVSRAGRQTESPSPLLCSLLGLLLFCVLAMAASQARADAAGLRERHAALAEELRHSPFDRPLHIDSAAGNQTLQGDVYAVLDHPFARVSTALRHPAQWCEVLILPFNTKYCHAVERAGLPGLLVRIGRKYDQPLERAFKLEFAYANAASGTDYFETRLDARDGPFGTRDYRIVVSAVPIDRGRTFLHLNYSYAYGMAGHLAMQGYLATVGASKVGFTVVGREASGHPRYIGGLRGAVERNAMRYYLAIDAYLNSLDAPAGQQLERRIQSWFSETERYPRQLHEMDRHTYVAMKRHEHERQQTAMIQ